MSVFRVVLVLAAFFWPLAAQAETRIALVVGNGDYASVQPLANPVNDAKLIAGQLEEKGFKVTLLIDAGQSEMTRAIARFGRELRDSGPEGTGLFYYAGHGVQSFGENYLLPTDVALTDAADLGLVAVPAQTILRQMASARNRTNIVILDACRNNPFTAIPDLGDNGLAEMKAPTGTFLAYSTAPGAVALDGIGSNSPFTEALVETISAPGLPIEQLFKQVRVRVLEETAGQQTPWDTSSLTREFSFVPAEQMSPHEIAAQQLWESVAATGDPVQIMLFLRSYPESRFAEEARAALAVAMEKMLAPGDAAKPATPPPALQETEPFKTAEPADRETEMLEAARKSGAVADYEAYLAAYPNGTFSELARLELAAIADAAASAPAQPAPAPAAPVPAAPTAAAPSPAPAPADVAALPPQQSGPIGFTMPLATGGEHVVGKSIEQLAQGSPLFPPIEGLDESIWKGQTCSNCHQWNRDRLCEQGKTYTAMAGERALSKLHPYGGGFKQALREWVEGGCAP